MIKAPHWLGLTAECSEMGVPPIATTLTLDILPMQWKSRVNYAICENGGFLETGDGVVDGMWHDA
jgi:hypothetical protein